MNKELVRTLGSVPQDNLIAKLYPAADTFGVVIRKGETAVTLKRGTVLAMSDTDGKHVMLGTSAAAAAEEGGEAESLTPCCILADPVVVGTEEDAVGVAYRCGNFNRKALKMAEGYALSRADEDKLRSYDIILTDML